MPWKGKSYLIWNGQGFHIYRPGGVALLLRFATGENTAYFKALLIVVEVIRWMEQRMPWGQ